MIKFFFSLLKQFFYARVTRRNYGTERAARHVLAQEPVPKNTSTF